MNGAAEVIEYLKRLQARFGTTDRRGVFVAAYLQVSEAVSSGLKPGTFRDAAWAERYMSAFGRLYRDALEAYDAKRPCPKAWRIAFDACARAETSVLQDLLMGVNAHINHDLPLALVEAGIDPRADRKADHDAVNGILEDVTDRLQASVEKLYSPVLAAADVAGGRLDEALANFSVRKARANAWRKAVLLADSPAFVRPLIREGIAEEAALIARLIRVPTATNPALRKALRAADEVNIGDLFRA